MIFTRKQMRSDLLAFNFQFLTFFNISVVDMPDQLPPRAGSGDSGTVFFFLLNNNYHINFINIIQMHVDTLMVH